MIAQKNVHDANHFKLMVFLSSGSSSIAPLSLSERETLNSVYYIQHMILP